MINFLAETKYVDYKDEAIQKKANELFTDDMEPVEKVKIAYEYVRDDIPHSFDCNATVITAKASDVLKEKTGICHAKANLLAALLRTQGIPVGFCFERITLTNNDSKGYCVHAYNAIYVENRWIYLDARGNKEGVNAQFSLEEPILAYPPRKEYDEYFFKGIYANSHGETMEMLEKAKTLQDIMDNIPEYVAEKSEIAEVGVEFDVHTQLKRGITEMRIERANLDDLQEILDLQYLAYQSEAELFPDQDIPPLKQTLTEVITEYQKGIILKVSDEDNVIIGSVRAHLTNGTVYIGKLIVHPQKQGQGIGTKLLLAIENEYPNQRYELFTSTRSIRNIALYQRLGYNIFDQKKITEEMEFVFLEKYAD